jgi:hypothetical protein
MPIAVCKLFALPSLWAAAPPWRSAAPPPDSRIIPPAHRMRSQSASLAGARSAFTVRPASGGGEQDGRREPWRMQRRTPEGSAPPLKGSPLPRSAHQRRTPKDGEPGSDPWRGADHGGACGSVADQKHSESDGQSIQSDSAPHCTWSSIALCWAEETGTRRQERTGRAAASRNQIRAQAGSRPGGLCSMPTELIEEGVGMAAFAEDSQTRPRLGATQGRLCNRLNTTSK